MIYQYLRNLIWSPDEEEADTLPAFGQADAANLPYRPFTTDFDVEIDAEELDFHLGWHARRKWKKAIQRYEKDRPSWLSRMECGDEPAAFPDAPAVGATDLVVSLLIDHSGSLRNGSGVLAYSVVEVAAAYLSRLGIPHEILGFTTTTWRGGLSRQKWLDAGKPSHPGRLCDLLHIIYKSADETYPGAPSELTNLLCESLLKENIDGEAIEWAAKRLRDRPEARKLIIVVSDGAAVDDSTLSANSLDTLAKHLRSTISVLSSEQGFRIAAIGLKFDVSRYYPRHLTISTQNGHENALVAFLNQCLVGEFIAELSPQHWACGMSDIERDRFRSLLPGGS